MKTVAHARAVIGILAVVLLSSSCERREIGVYWVEKEETGAGGGPAQVRLPAEPPESWQATGVPSRPRVATYLVAAPEPGDELAELAVTVFPGEVGGLLANVNRWRGEMALPDITGEQLAEATERIEQSGHTIHLVDAAGAGRQTLGAILPVAGETWFFKLTGAEPIVSANRDAFLDFLGGLEISSTPPAPPTTPAAPVEPGQPVLSFDRPDAWIEEAANRPRVASFRVAGESGQQAEIAVIALNVSTGAKLATVNMWRSTMGLAATTEDELPAMIETLEVGEQKFDIVEFESDGPVAEGGRPARLIVAYAAIGEHTWYFKITGDTDLVAAQKPSLLEFLKSAEFGATR